MNQVEIGKFIAGCRKEKGLTQVQLAEKLNITDRAVSKWETGKSMPDSSIMLELCEILGITVNELLSGERIEMNSNYEEKVSENLIEFKRKDENNLKKNTVISIVYSITMIIAALVCCICDIATSGTVSWSKITLASILFAWVISFPLILLGKKGILVSLISITVFIFPYLVVLGLAVDNRAVMVIGVVMATISLLFMWAVYLLFRKFKDRKLFAAGIATLMAVPFTLIVNITLSRMIGEPVIDVWDILSAFIILVVAVGFFIGDYSRRKHISTL
ncbi:MAG: helix-turn-helix domain-containing protein [Lachnospiraceae bacterium]|nr:helix-turn-helix domain-containing protein [Lachnospiraceae bacterium]